MALFLSTFTNKIDKKGRVSVPVTFRTALAGQPFLGIVAFRSYKSPSIEACGIDRMTQLSQSVDRLDLFSETQDDFASTIFADSHQLPFDSEGRIMLPQELLAHAQIESHAAFVGRGATFQIWSPEIFQKHQSEARKRIHEKKATLKLTDTSSPEEGAR
ncbi:MAG: division/cell wall cluster transcriptional repressor MraZ [Alphaproteobacteria bacterium]|jgi:MraZ protein|nr:division/cell wall cluster transcriptional repressor MraZ [Alphaproteobacteria bacterium]MBT5390008.1 division/cell wall cluster transcriptional repressor MraZ [Alphaproteobacteria bacterium]MBT5540900.1 division/cell wall cluster transcriptional repressor MraZ [Alphaproteobacteria bacterium]MBT5654957.1 division/cell wall cluster transcriptional repressor MraZ [Alphaproteobacteria bacterium]